MITRRARPPAFFRLCLLSLTAILAAWPAAGQSYQPGKSYALLIGVGAYKDWPPLVNPVPDVRALAAELKQHYGFLPEVLENPKREELLGQIRRYFRLSYGPQDQLMIIFAGHGTYDEVTRLGYLAASDSAGRARDANFSTLTDYPELLALIDNIPCRQILLVIDACYSGSLGEERSAGPAGSSAEELAKRWKHKSRRFLTSGGKEYVPDGKPDQHTPFVARLLGGLRSTGKAGVLTIEALQDAHMKQLEPKPRWGSFGSDEGQGGFFFFARGPATSPGASLAAAVVATATASSPPAPPAPSSRLRATPARVSESELKNAFRRLELFDLSRSPEGNFPHQYRAQTKGKWDVVVDLETNLMWQRGGSGQQMSRREADAYIAGLNSSQHAGYADWRLPTLEEIASLLEPDRMGNDLHISPYFSSDQDACWSADSDLEGDPYYVSFNSGMTALGYGNKAFFVRAVRTGQ